MTDKIGPEDMIDEMKIAVMTFSLRAPWVHRYAAFLNLLCSRIKGLTSVRQKCKVHNHKGNGVLELFQGAFSFSLNCRGEKEPALLQKHPLRTLPQWRGMRGGGVFL